MNEHKHDDLTEDKAAPQPDEKKTQEKARGGRRLLRRALQLFAGIMILLAAAGGGGLFFLRTQSGEAWLAGMLNGALENLPGGLSASVESFHGPIPSRGEVSHILLKDKNGVWLEAESLGISLDWSALPGAFVVAELSLEKPQLLRLPVTVPSDEQEEPTSSVEPGQAIADAGGLFRRWPSWLPAVRVEHFRINGVSLPQELLGKSLTASLAAEASAGKNGAELSLEVRRNDIVCPPLVLKADFSPEAEGRLTLHSSDLGLLALLPEHAESDGALRFSLEAALSPERITADFSGDMQDTEKEEKNLTAAAQAAFSLRAADLYRGEASLKIDMVPDAALWKIAGQKGGKLTASFNIRTTQKDSLDLHAEADLGLADMAWNETMLSALLGRACTLSSAATVSLGSENLGVTLEKFSFQAERMTMAADGELALPGKALTADASTRLHAEAVLDDAADISPDLSGKTVFKADISGPMNALSAGVSLSGDRLGLPGLLLEKTDARLDIPHADIPRLLKELPELVAQLEKTAAPRSDATEKTAATPTKEAEKNTLANAENAEEPLPLLAGSLGVSLRANGQKTTLDAAWNVAEHAEKQRPGLLLALDRLSLHLENNVVEGALRALMPFSAPVPEKGTIAVLAGTPLPELEGGIKVGIRQWTPLARLSGMKMTGSPLTLEMKLSSLEGQNLELKTSLDRLNIVSGKESLSLAGLKTSLKAKDIWGKPDIDLGADLHTFKLPGLSLARVAAVVKGGEKGIQAHAESHGDIRSEIRLRWKPGEVFVQTLNAEAAPSVLGLAGTESVGLRLNAPATLRYQEERVSCSSLSLSLLPSGTLNLAGSWTPKKSDVKAALQGLDLGRMRGLVPELPQGMVEGHVSLAGTAQRPSGNFMLNFKNVLIPGSSLPPLDGELTGSLVSGRKRALELALVLPETGRKALGLDTLLIDLSIPLTSNGSVPLPDMKGRLKGSIALAGELAQIWKLAPTVDQKLSGRLNLNADISGTPAAPLLTLDTGLDNGSFADIAQGVELRHMKLKAEAEALPLTRNSDRRLEFTFSADDGRKGTLNLSGSLAPYDLALDVEGRMEKLSPLRRQDANVMLSGAFTVSGTALDPSVRADITVDKGQVQLARLPGGDIVTLPIYDPDRKKEEKAPPLKGRLNVRIHIPNQFFLRGYGLECEWKGDIRLRGPVIRPAVTGGIQAVRGTLDILGKRFKLSEGEITFDGGWPVSPALNVVMEYASADITADITLSGTAAKPEIELSSEPELPKDEIISHIMFGQSTNSLSHVQALQLAAGAAELAGFGGGGVMDLGRKVFGLDVLKFNSENDDTADTDTSRTSLEMGTYVRDNVYVGVEQGLGKESETEAVVEIELSPGLEAQAKTSATRTEVGLEWKKNY